MTGIWECAPPDKLLDNGILVGYIPNERSVGMAMKTSSPPRPSASVDQIRAVAIDLFAQKGFAATSMRDIAETAGLSVAGVYHHFHGKDELLFRIQEDAYERLIAPVRALPFDMPHAQKIERIIHNHVVFFADQITEMKVLSHELTALEGDRGRRIRTMQREYFTLCLKAVTGLLRASGQGVRSARAATMCLFGMINWIYTWYRPDRDGDPRHLAKLMTRIFMCGLDPNPECIRLAKLQRRNPRRTPKVR